MLGLSTSSNFDLNKNASQYAGASTGGIRTNLAPDTNLFSIIASVQNDIKNLKT